MLSTASKSLIIHKPSFEGQSDHWSLLSPVWGLFSKSWVQVASNGFCPREQDNKGLVSPISVEGSEVTSFMYFNNRDSYPFCFRTADCKISNLLLTQLLKNNFPNKKATL